MSDATTTHTAIPMSIAVPSLEKKCRRVIDRHGRLTRLVETKAPEMVVRNERRLLRTALKDLIDDSEVGEFVSYVGAKVFTDYFNYIAGIEIELPAVNPKPMSLGG